MGHVRKAQKVRIPDGDKPDAFALPLSTTLLSSKGAMRSPGMMW
jgi:hypothetical protein